MSEATSRIAQAPRGTYNLLLRATGINNRRPDPPREVRFDNGFLRFSAARTEDEFSLYVIRIDRDNGQPDIVVPYGTRVVAVPTGSKAYVSTLRNGMESERASVAMTFTAVAGNAFLEFTLAAGATPFEVTAPDGTDGQLLFLQVINNAAGNGVIELGPNFEADVEVDLAGYDGSKNRWIFVWKENEWRLWAKSFLGI